MNVFDAAELDTERWLKWQVLCYMYFFFLKKNMG